ncbi:MAG: hypothetical protein HY400_04185, partial [Elusimicrobia bacterium]|nr:hypothetical protein [Elusimicrobiota bacterium]
AITAHVPEYARYIRKKIAELGRESIAFRTQYALEWVKGYYLSHKKKTIAQEVDPASQISWTAQKTFESLYQISAGKYQFEANLKNMNLKGLNPSAIALLTEPPPSPQPMRPKPKKKRIKKVKPSNPSPTEDNSEYILPGIPTPKTVN